MKHTDARAEFLAKTERSLSEGTFVKMTFGKYRGGDSGFRNLSVTMISTAEGDKLSFRFSYTDKDTVKNYVPEEGLKLVSAITGNDFLSASLFTVSADYSLDYSKKRVPILHTRRPQFSQPLPRAHNREKKRIVDSSSGYLHLLGITSREGQVHADKYGKFRQVDKFIQTVDSLLGSSVQEDGMQFKAADLGSGKSYLTFALYDYLTNTKKWKAEVTGIEQRQELADTCNAIAGNCGFTGLRFVAGRIPAEPEGHFDMVTALHACDTATDDAIKFALNAGAVVIMLAPCCQKYVRKKLTVPGYLQPILKHRIQEERFAVMLTDSLRALTLEAFGYETKVFEFISTEHTARNTMITAVRSSGSQEKVRHARSEAESLKKEFSLDDYYLDKLTGI